MTTLIPLLIFFVLITGSHAAFLLFAKRIQGQPEQSKRRLWQIHFAVNGILWLVLSAGVIVLQILGMRMASPWMIIIGVLLGFAGLFLAFRSNVLLGLDQAMGLRFFFPEKTHEIRASLYHWFKNPMYDGFLLILIGLGFALGITEDFYLAGASFLLLNLFLATVENYRFSWNPF